MCFLYYSCCEEMVTHRAKFNSYAEFSYGCSNESRKVIIKKVTSCTGNIALDTNDKSNKCLITCTINTVPKFFLLSQLHLTLHSCITQTTKKIEYTK